MPELPEVETVCRSLAPFIIGKTIYDCQVRAEKLIKSSDSTEFIKKITNRTFVDIIRRGKYILLKLDNKETLVVHLRMTGKLLICDKTEPLGKHTHICFQLKDTNKELRYDDTRKFGILYLGDEESLKNGIDQVIDYAEKIKLEMKQDAVALEIDNEMFFI